MAKSEEVVDESATQPIERKLIRTGELRFKTEDIATTHQFLLEKAENAGGYISDESSSSGYNRTDNTMVIRVPADKLDALVQDITQHASVLDHKHISANDVTMQYIDVTARLETKKQLEIQYQSILTQAKTVEEIMSVERELSLVRADLESMQGQLRYLNNQIDFSTLTVNYYTESNSQGPGFGNKFSEAIDGGWELLKSFLVGIVYLWPFILLLIIMLFFFRYISRRAKKKLTGKQEFRRINL